MPAVIGVMAIYTITSLYKYWPQFSSLARNNAVRKQHGKILRKLMRFLGEDKGWKLIISEHEILIKASQESRAKCSYLMSAFISVHISWLWSRSEACSYPQLPCIICQQQLLAGDRVIPRFGKQTRPIHFECELAAIPVHDSWRSYLTKIFYTIRTKNIEDPKELRNHCLSRLQNQYHFIN